MKSIACLFLFLAVGCVKHKEQSSNIRAIFRNESVYPVKIEPFQDGVLINQLVLIINPGEEVQFANTSHLGLLGNNAGIDSDYFSDSIRDTYDNRHEVTHYGEVTPASFPRKYFRIREGRNLFTMSNFEQTVLRQTGTFRLCQYTYIYSLCVCQSVSKIVRSFRGAWIKFVGKINLPCRRY